LKKIENSLCPKALTVQSWKDLTSRVGNSLALAKLAMHKVERQTPRFHNASNARKG
jgi:hypothetical protein